MLQNTVKTLLDPDEEYEDKLLDRQTASCHIFADCNLLILPCGQAQTEASIHGDPNIRPDIHSHWSSAIADTIQVLGCNCIWCRRNSDWVSYSRQLV